MWSLFRGILIALMTLLAIHAETIGVRADDIAEGERQFVQELMARQFFDLAEQFSSRQSETSRTPDGKSAWQLMLADAREQHSWALREPGRTQILTHAAQEITEFVRKENVSAEFDVLLRVRQIELLATIARIDAIVSTFGPQSAPQPLTLQAIEEGMELASAMLSQIDLIRRDIDNTIAKSARDRLLYVIGELTLFQSRQQTDNRTLQSEAISTADKLMKSSGDDDMRFKARLLLAESSLDQKDFKRFDLLVTSLSSAAERPSQKLEVVTLKVRGLREKGEPSEALQVCLNSEKDALRSQELRALRLAALMDLFELLHKLEAPELQQNTASEFQILNDRLKSETTGVWRECCERIAMRFDHVQKFGPEAATILESVSAQIAANKLSDARTALIAVSQPLGKLKPETAAILWMQAGDLSIRMSEWNAAESDLAEAAMLFQTAGNRNQEAASDLLRIYAIGRRWDAEESNSNNNKEELQQAYRNALDSHLKKFHETPTTAKAREWRAMLVRSTAPITAAEEFLALATDTDANNDLPVLLVQAGEILMEVLATSSVDTTPAESQPYTRALTNWSKLANQVLSKDVAPDTNAAHNWPQPVLGVEQLVFSLQSQWTAEGDWKTLGTRARQLLIAIHEQADSEADKDSSKDAQQTAMTSASNFANGLIILASFRQLLPLDTVQQSRDDLLQQPEPLRRQVAQFLLRQAQKSGTPIPGDPQLGFLALDLLKPDDNKPRPINEQIEKLPVLLAASNAADNYQQFDATIEELADASLSDENLRAISETLQQLPSKNAARSTTSEPVKRFWQSLLRRSQTGDDRWLEASLQLALIAEQQQNLQEASKVLNVIDALHPEWGTPERKSRAAALRERLELPK